MKRTLALFRLNLLLEWRSKHILVLLLTTSVMLAVIMSLSLGSGFFDPSTRLKLTPPLLWILFLCAGSVIIGKCFEAETETRALDALLLCGFTPREIYWAKTASNFLLLFASFLTSAIALVVLLNVPSPANPWGVLGPAALAVLGFSALATLLSGMTIGSKLKHMLLPLLLLPLSIPLILNAVELSSAAILQGNVLSAEQSLPLLQTLTLVYLALGHFLFEVVIRD